jgi:hypothetical protein
VIIVLFLCITWLHGAPSGGQTGYVIIDYFFCLCTPASVLDMYHVYAFRNTLIRIAIFGSWK